MMPNHGPATPTNRPVFEWNRTEPAQAEQLAMPPAEVLAERHSPEALADLYWRARHLPGETTTDEAGRVHHGPRSRRISDALKLALSDAPPRPI